MLEQARDTRCCFDVSFRADAGQLVALVGPSGAGKTTISHLVPRLYDVRSGVDPDQRCRRPRRDPAVDPGAIGVVTQDAHLFHESIRANLLYARPDATEDELIEALRAAQILPLVELAARRARHRRRRPRLPTVRRREAAHRDRRLLLKAPDIVVLDEATAHLDSESEVAVQTSAEQRALAVAPHSSSRIGCRPSARPTRSWSSTTAGSSSAVPTPR